MEQPIKELPVDRKNPMLQTDTTFAFLGKDDPILQELWTIKAQINKDAQYNVQERHRQVRGLTFAKAKAQLGLV